MERFDFDGPLFISPESDPNLSDDDRSIASILYEPGAEDLQPLNYTLGDAIGSYSELLNLNGDDRQPPNSITNAFRNSTINVGLLHRLGHSSLGDFAPYRYVNAAGTISSITSGFGNGILIESLPNYIQRSTRQLADGIALDPCNDAVERVIYLASQIQRNQENVLGRRFRGNAARTDNSTFNVSSYFNLRRNNNMGSTHGNTRPGEDLRINILLQNDEEEAVEMIGEARAGRCFGIIKDILENMINPEEEGGAARLSDRVFKVLVPLGITAFMSNNAMTNNTSSSSNPYWWVVYYREVGFILGVSFCLAGFAMRGRRRGLSIVMDKLGTLAISSSLVFCLGSYVPHQLLAWIVESVAILVIVMAVAFA